MNENKHIDYKHDWTWISEVNYRLILAIINGDEMSKNWRSKRQWEKSMEKIGYWIIKW